MNRLLVSLSTVLLVSTSLAQDLPIDEQPEIRRYTVEVIVFSYAEDVSIGTEIFPGDEPEIEDTPLDLADEFGDEYGDEVNDAASDDDTEVPLLRELELVPVTRDELTLTETYERLLRLDAYRPIMHVGWTQPTYPPEETPAIQLRALGRVPQGLDGSFTLYLSRYLHLIVDLALDAPGPASPVTEDPELHFGDSRAQNDAMYTAMIGPVRYRIQEDRIFKSGDLRYFDHPKFGVIAKITRVEDDKPEDDSATLPASY